jgi:hypothetical protein
LTIREFARSVHNAVQATMMVKTAILKGLRLFSVCLQGRARRGKTALATFKPLYNMRV